MNRSRNGKKKIAGNAIVEYIQWMLGNGMLGCCCVAFVSPRDICCVLCLASPFCELLTTLLLSLSLFVVLNCLGLCLEGRECGPGERTNKRTDR